MAEKVPQVTPSVKINQDYPGSYVASYQVPYLSLSSPMWVQALWRRCAHVHTCTICFGLSAGLSEASDASRATGCEVQVVVLRSRLLIMLVGWRGDTYGGSNRSSAVVVAAAA